MKNIAFAGCAHIHTPSFIKMLKERSNEFKVVKVWDHNAERAKANAESLNAIVCTTPEEIANDPTIDAVVITSETNRHQELTTLMANAGKHLFVEKPLGFAAADAKELAQLIRSKGIIFQTGYFLRGIGAIRQIKKLADEGKFGTITRMRFCNCHTGSLGGWFDADWRWMADPAIAGCGAFGDLGTHALDIIMWLLGRPSKVTASIHTVTARYGAECDESGEALLEFPSGAIATFAAGWVDHSNPMMCEVSGTKAHAAIVFDKFYFSDNERTYPVNREPVEDVMENLPHAFQLFLDKLNGKDVALVDAFEAADRNIVMEAAYKSSAEGIRLNIEY